MHSLLDHNSLKVIKSGLHVPINLNVWPCDLFETMNPAVMDSFAVRCSISITRTMKIRIKISESDSLNEYFQCLIASNNENTITVRFTVSNRSQGQTLKFI